MAQHDCPSRRGRVCAGLYRGDEGERFRRRRARSLRAEGALCAEGELISFAPAQAGSNHIVPQHPPGEPQHEAEEGAEQRPDNAVAPPHQRADRRADGQAGRAEDQQHEGDAPGIVEDADVGHAVARTHFSVPLTW